MTSEYFRSAFLSYASSFPWRDRVSLLFKPPPPDGAGALCLLRFFFELPESSSVVVFVLVGAVGMGAPGLDMNAIPRRWRGSVGSNLAGRKTIGRLAGLGRWNAYMSVNQPAFDIETLTTPSACRFCTMVTNFSMLGSLHRTMPIVTGVNPSRARYATGIILLVKEDR